MAARKAPAPRFTLWGCRRDDVYGVQPIRLTGGTQRQCESARRERERENHHDGWLLGIYADGTAPTGLRMQVEQIRNGAK